MAINVLDEVLICLFVVKFSTRLLFNEPSSACQSMSQPTYHWPPKQPREELGELACISPPPTHTLRSSHPGMCRDGDTQGSGEMKLSHVWVGLQLQHLSGKEKGGSGMLE